MAGTPKVFRSSAAAELSRPALAEAASNSFAVPVSSLRSTRIPSLLKLLWLKIDIRSQPRQIHFYK
jgi:hypothetical protein